MAQAEINISGRRDGKTFPSLDAWIAHVAEIDIPKLLPAVATAELDAQKKAGNPPSNILVDGRAATESTIARAQRRVQMFFVDVALLTRAVTVAYDELMRLYTRQTGAAARTIQLWGRSVSGASIRHERIGGIGGVGDWLHRHRHPGTYVRLIGPDVAFRRQLYYTPPGSRARFTDIRKFSARRLGELERMKMGPKARAEQRMREGRARTRISIQSSGSVTDIVLRKLKAQFGRSVYISGSWIEAPVPPWKGQQKRRQGLPAIALGFRLKGAL
jgi:hypothetical protein